MFINYFALSLSEKDYSEKAYSNDENANKEEESYKCEFIECKTTFKSKQSLWKHIYKVHGGLEYKCDLCDSIFYRRYLLKEHLVTAHNISDEDLKCYKCDKFFKCKKSLKYHKLTFHTHTGLGLDS